MSVLITFRVTVPQRTFPSLSSTVCVIKKKNINVIQNAGYCYDGETHRDILYDMGMFLIVGHCRTVKFKNDMVHKSIEFICIHKYLLPCTRTHTFMYIHTHTHTVHTHTLTNTHTHTQSELCRTYGEAVVLYVLHHVVHVSDFDHRPVNAM
jgi:ectoine hydroxylase-related dioxygenase (phytanoyl-CoA dioxygenase family)